MLKLSLFLGLFLVCLAVASGSLISEDDFAPQYHFKTCSKPLCRYGSFIASLAMAMSSHKPYTFDTTSGNPTYTPQILVDSLLRANISPKALTTNTISTHLFPVLSPHLHFTHAFTLDALTVDSKLQLCSQLQAFPAFYLVQTSSPASVAFLSHCSRRGDQMVMTYQSPLHNKPVEMSFEEFAALSPTLFEVLVSYNSFEKFAYTQRIQHLNNRLSQTGQQQHTNAVFLAHQTNIYNEHQYTAEYFGGGDEWEIPYLWVTTFHQGDYNDIMQTKTIAQVGCLITSVAIGLRNHGIKFDDKIDVNPSTWNSFIRDHNGYEDDNFIHTTVDAVKCTGCATYWNDTDARHATNDVPAEYIQGLLKQTKRHVVAHVNNFHHFVAVIGWSRTTPGRFRVLDPAARRDWFDYEEINGWRLYDIKGPVDHYRP